MNLPRSRPQRLAVRILGSLLAIAALVAAGCASTGSPIHAGRDPGREMRTSDSPGSGVRPGDRGGSSEQGGRDRARADHGERRARGSLAMVARVIDGDTIEVVFRSRSLDVRLIGVDTPETVHPSEPVECFGPQASSFTERRLGGERIRLEFDLDRIDPYGRTLAYVWLDGRLFNQVLVSRGFATVSIYEPNDAYEARLDRAQESARSADRGIWGSCSGPSSAGGAGSSGGSVSAGGGGGGCTPGYSPCLRPASDYDCAGGSGDGPEYTGRVTVTGSDPYGLDENDDGVGCE